MSLLQKKFATSPVHARFLPFLLFFLPLLLQDSSGDAMRYWIYLARTILGAWCLWEMRSLVPEMKWAISWEAVFVGVLIAVVWVGLDPYYPKNELLFKQTPPWNPFHQFGDHSALAWFFFGVRTLGSAIVVPPLEEVFYRSLLYRYFIRTDFQNLPFSRFHFTSFVVTSGIFAFEHYQWLAGILCGFAYQGLVIRKNRLGDAITAHGITNFLLALWICWKGDWKFW
jgi:CAAX prenyl protease-like protein